MKSVKGDFFDYEHIVDNLLGISIVFIELNL